jgi:hypothetical protein
MRQVMYESTSVTVFKMDSEAKEIRVEEFNVLELDSMLGGNQVSLGAKLLTTVCYCD